MDIMKFIGESESISAAVHEKVLTAAEIWALLQEEMGAEERESAIRELVVDAISGAIRHEAKRIRIALKAGRAPETPLPWLLHGEIEWQGALSDAAFDHYRKTVLGMWILPNGRPLGAVTAEYLRKLAADELGKAEGHRKTADFYHRISQDLPGDAIIWNHISSGTAEAVRLSVFGDTPKSCAA